LKLFPMAGKKEHPNITLLKSPEIGGVLAKGLAMLYHDKPKFPVDYLAKWLLNYSREKESEKDINKGLKLKEELIKKQKIAEQEALMKKNREEEEKIEDQSIDLDCKNLIQSHEYHMELLADRFPNFLENRRNLTGVYVAQLDLPRKAVDPLDDEENAHVDQEKPKQLNYVGYSDSHSFLMGKCLNMEQGIYSHRYLIDYICFAFYFIFIFVEKLCFPYLRYYPLIVSA
jgi:hypothetical protein